VTPDVIVVGGGPAGALLARQLARDGAQVALATAATSAGTEGLSARTTALLAEEGLEALVHELARPVPRTGRWGARAVSGSECLVDRVWLAARLRAAAAAAGVALCEQPVVATTRDAAGFTVSLRDGRAWRAPLLVDARGRRGAGTRGPPALALGQRYRHRSPGAPGAVVHALRDGWCWIATDAGSSWLQLIGRPRARRPDDWLRHAAAELPAVAALLAGAAPTGPRVARPAHVRLGRPSADPGLWRVGDAALALDPLSGQGVYEALRGARLVAAALRSVRSGVDVGLARRFVFERTQQVYARAAATAAAFYAENEAAGCFHATAAAAYRALAAASLPLPVPAARPPAIERRPVLADGYIREREVLVTAAAPRGVWHVAGVPVVELMDFFRVAEHATVDGAAAALDRPAAAVATAVRWLAGAGALPVHRAEPVSAGG